MDTLIKDVLKTSNYNNNPYFKALQKQIFDKNDFIETQCQFYNAVKFFSRPMAVVAAKIPNPELRIEILRNVWEEHGEGDTTQMHGITFKELLFRLDKNSIKNIENASLSPDVRLFNTALTGVSVMDDFAVGVSVFGIIERMFVDISAWIAEEIVNNQWLAEDQLIHYTVHKKLDLKHSQDFFDVLGHYHTEKKYEIEQGLMMGATMFNNLYEGLYKNRKNRY